MLYTNSNYEKTNLHVLLIFLTWVTCFWPSSDRSSTCPPV